MASCRKLGGNIMTLSRPIKTIKRLNKIDFLKLAEDDFWNANKNDEPEIRMHKIHVYPAKFPSIIAKRAFTYAKNNRSVINRVVDIFCGCGTVAVEAKRNGFEFWGCDINPVAVLISEVKSYTYDVQKVETIYSDILVTFQQNKFNPSYEDANKRLQYWFSKEQYNDLYQLKSSIIEVTEDDEYRKLFFCVFSSILKGTSKWLTKSIKPQVDPRKNSKKVVTLFCQQMEYVEKAIIEANYQSTVNITIEHNNVLDIERDEYADMIITSPPYVTSYEYADLHQLSALWLGYTDNYTDLRSNSIGSSYGVSLDSIPIGLTPTAEKIISYYRWEKSQTRSIARYYSDMQKFSDKAFEMLRSNGLAVFVIGDTEIRGHHIENAKCLCECLIKSGFGIKEISKRAVKNKLLPSHRDSIGRFSSDKSQRSIYSQEYIIIGRKA
jgi:methylase of polypeptide subunit release factors